MSSQTLQGHSERLFRYFFEQASLGIAVENLEGTILLANPALCSMLGYKVDQLCGMSCAHFANPEDSQDDLALFQQLREGSIEHYSLEKRYVRKDGTRLWGRLNVSLLKGADGGGPLVIAFVEDIADRKRAVEALKKSEEKFSKAFRESPMAITMISARDNRYLDANETFLQLTGWQREEVIGKSPVDTQICAEASQREKLLERILAEGAVRDQEIRFRHKDGAEKIGLCSGELIEIDNEPCMLFVIADITQRKRADEALATMSGRLLEAQEQERSRIARELHDDIAQRMALLAVELAQLEEYPADSTLRISNRVRELRNQATEISNDVQNLSHELHSAKLEYLGAVAAMRSWCREFGERQKMNIEFKSRNVPSPLPREIALCLFRVLQEAVHNSVKHSGVRKIEVQLWGESDEINLVISDAGRGFDLETALQSAGLGLISMQERVRIVKGTIAIQSRPMGGGSTIHVRVPFAAESDSERVAG